MEQFRERKCPETIQLEEYLKRRKKSRRNQASERIDNVIKENAEWFLTAFSF